MSVEEVFYPCARRTLLLGAAAMGVAVVAGCGSDDPATPAAPAKSTAGAPPTTAGGNPFDDGGTAGGGGNEVPANAIVAAGEVPVGGGVVVKDVLVVQPTKGSFKAYNAACPHEGALVEPPYDGNPVIQCPRHNSKFKTADGSLVQGPATRGLSGVRVAVKNGYVVRG